MQISDTQPLDYLVIGHITQDLVKGGAMLGGTASYSTMTAHALGAAYRFGDFLSQMAASAGDRTD